MVIMTTFQLSSTFLLIIVKCSQKLSNFKSFLKLQFSISRLQTLGGNKSILVNFRNKFFMGVGVPDFREEQLTKKN